METIQVKAELREAGGKGNARQLRMKGRIPAILYGAGEDSLPIALDAVSFEYMLRHISTGNAILDLAVSGRSGANVQVLIKEVQRNPIDSKILHVDLEHISMTRKVKVQIPVVVTGVPIGVKEGGILEHLLREIEVECLPSEIPDKVVIDVSHLDRGNSIHVRELPLTGVHILDSPERVVATVVGKTREEEPVAAPAAAEGAEGAAGDKEKGEKSEKSDKPEKSEKSKGA